MSRISSRPCNALLDSCIYLDAKASDAESILTPVPKTISRAVGQMMQICRGWLAADRSLGVDIDIVFYGHVNLQ